MIVAVPNYLVHPGRPLPDARYAFAALKHPNYEVIFASTLEIARGKVPDKESR